MAKFYVVWKGRQTGIFTSWNVCKAQVDGYSAARFKSFPTRDEAEAAFKAGTPKRYQRSHDQRTAKLGETQTRRQVKQPATRVKRKQAAGPETLTQAGIAALTHTLKIFTDGACNPNPGESGSGIAVYRKSALTELWYGLYNPNGTNNTAELNALNQALLLARQEIKAGNTAAIFCDSKYSIQCISQWAVKWEKNGWTKKGGEIMNLDIIREMFATYQNLKKDVPLFHVNGHVGIEGNELADRMSMLAIESQDAKFIRYTEIINIPTILAMRPG